MEVISKTLNCYWKKHFTDQRVIYKTLKYINLQEYKPGKLHTLLQLEPKSARDINRIPAKLKLLCGAYTLQSTRTTCNQATVNPICQLCNTDEETLEHFILKCSVLEHVRNPIISDMSNELEKLGNFNFYDLQML